MILSDSRIQGALNTYRYNLKHTPNKSPYETHVKEVRQKYPAIKIEPFKKERLNPNSYNVTLDSFLQEVIPQKINVSLPCQTEYIEITDEGYELLPGTLYLGRTVEWTETFNAVPMLEGRSSLARLGLGVHVSAGFGDNGYCGHWTLEITCVHPTTIFAGMEIAQVFFHTLEGASFSLYKGKYQNTEEELESKLYTEFQ